MLRKLTILLAAVLALVAVLASGAAAHRDDAHFPHMRLAHKGELVQTPAPGSFAHWSHKGEYTGYYDHPYLWPHGRMVDTGRYTIILEHPTKPIHVEILAYKRVQNEGAGGYGAGGAMKLHRKLVPIYRGGKVDAWAVKFNINRPHRPYYLVVTPDWPQSKTAHSNGKGERDFHVETR